MTRRDLMKRAAALAGAALVPLGWKAKTKPPLRFVVKFDGEPRFDPSFKVYGGPASLWGQSFTSSDVNAADFGVTTRTI